MSKNNFNLTEMNPALEFELHVLHRERFSHFLRWSFVLKQADIGMKILDICCGSGNLFEVFYRNKYKPTRYLGLEYRKQTVCKNIEKWSKYGAEFQECDITKKDFTKFGKDWNIITLLEGLEHIGINHVQRVLIEIKKCMNDKTLLMLSTPCYDEKVGAASNHTFDSGDGRGVSVQEMTYHQFKEFIEKSGLKIKKHYGTFSSQRDYKGHLKKYPGLEDLYNKFHEYFDSNVLSVIMAPLFPEHSRNVLWEVTL